MLPVSVFICLGWLLSVCLHEFGHALVAYWGGDTSVKDKGYLTLNPLKYTHPILSIIVPVIFLLLGGIALPGAAVYIDQERLRSRWWQSAVSAAGPLTSLLVAWLLSIPFRLRLVSPTDDSFGLDLISPPQEYWLWPALALLITLKIYLVLLNLLPIPPLDGYGIIAPWLHKKIQRLLRRFGGFGLLFLFMLLWIVTPLNLLLVRLTILVTETLGVSPTMIATGAQLFDRSLIAWLGLAVGILLLLSWIIFKPQAVLYSLGCFFAQQQGYKKAIAFYNKAIQLQPNYDQAWEGRASVLQHLQRYEEALASWDRLIQIKLKNSHYWQRRGWVLEQLQRDDEAINSYNKAIEIQPDNYDAWSCLYFLLLYKLKRPEEALPAYERAVQLMPNDAYFWQNRGSILYSLQQYEEAIASYDKALQLKPEEPFLWRIRAQALEELQRNEEAVACYEKALQLQPNDYYIQCSNLVGLGRLLFQLQKYEAALAVYDKAIEFKPNESFLWEQRGWMLLHLQRYEEAFAAYTQALQLEPSNCINLLCYLGAELETLQRYSEALACYDKAIQTQPNEPYVWYYKARYYARQGDVDLTIQILQKVLNLAPDSWEKYGKNNPDFAKILDDERFNLHFTDWGHSQRNF